MKRKSKNEKNECGRPFDTILPEKSILPAYPWANMEGRRNKNAFKFVLFKVIDSITDANSGC